MKIYLAYAGGYSDRHVVGAYSTREKAEAMARAQGGGYVPEFEVDPDTPVIPEGMAVYEVVMNTEGDTKSVNILALDYMTGDPGEHEPYGDDKHVAFTMWARDPAHAVKIANEKRTRLIATGEWSTDWELWRTNLDKKESLP